MRRSSFDKNEKSGTAKWTADGFWNFVFGSYRRRRRIAWLQIWRQQVSGTFELRFAGRAEDAVVADLGRALRQDVLKKSIDELDAGKRDVLHVLSPIVAITKTNLPILDGFQTAVGNGNAKDVACKIVEDLVAAAGMLGMHHPIFLPNGSRYTVEQACLF